MLARIYRVYCLGPHDQGLPKHTALSEQLHGFNSCRYHTPLLYPAGLRRCWQSVFIKGSSLVDMACVHLSYFPFLFLSLSWVGLGQCVGVGAGFYTMLLPHGHLYLTKIGEASRSFWLAPGRPGRSWRFEDEDVPGVRESGSAQN